MKVRFSKIRFPASRAQKAHFLILKYPFIYWKWDFRKSGFRPAEVRKPIFWFWNNGLFNESEVFENQVSGRQRSESWFSDLEIAFLFNESEVFENQVSGRQRSENSLSDFWNTLLFTESEVFENQVSGRQRSQSWFSDF